MFLFSHPPPFMGWEPCDNVRSGQRGSEAARQRGSGAAGQRGSGTARQRGCGAVRLRGCGAAGLRGYEAARLRVEHHRFALDIIDVRGDP